MTAVILAAGFSRRFGKEKLLIKIENKPMILKVIELVTGLNFERIILVYRKEEIKKLAEGFNVNCRLNASTENGLSSSIACGVQKTPPTDAYIFFLGDQPFIDAESVKKLISAYYEGKGSIVVPTYEGQRGNPVIFDYSFKKDLEILSGDTGGRTIIEANPDKVCYVELTNKTASRDIDTWEEYLLLEGVYKNEKPD